MIKLEEGAKVKVRLHTGEVVEAVYGYPKQYGNEHWVALNNPKRLALAGRVIKCETRFNFEKVRFVGNPCVLLHEGVSV